MNFKTTLLTLLMITGVSFLSCSDELCDCCTTGEYRGFFDVQDMRVNHFDANFRIVEESEILFEDYGAINLHFIVDYVVSQEFKHFDFSLINAAYGCSPVQPGIEGSKEEAIESLQVITVNDFDEDHKAGESINDLLEMVDIILGNDPMLLEDFLNDFTGNVPSEYFTLRLLERPNLSDDFQVSVMVELSTGESYEATSDVITFL